MSEDNSNTGGNVTDRGPGVTRPTYNEGFATVFQKTIGTMSRLDRPSSYYRCLMYCLSGPLHCVDFRTLPNSRISKDIGMSIAQVERAMRLLERDRAIITDGTGPAKRRRISRRIASGLRVADYQAAETQVRDPDICDSVAIDNVILATGGSVRRASAPVPGDRYN